MSRAHLQPERPDLEKRSYLGDGAYVGIDQFGSVHLWTTNGVTVTNNVVLEPAVLHALVDWLRGSTPIE